MFNADKVEKYDVEETDLALLLYTGGTTGQSKGVKLSHRNIVANGMQMAIAMNACKTDIYLHAAPMFHAADLLCTMIIMCLTDSSFGEFNTSQMRMMLYGSSPMAAEWVEKAIKGFKETEIVQGYGLTETSPILTFLDWEDHKKAIDTGELEILRAAGRPVVGLEMRIKDESGNDLPAGEVGEVAVRGPQVSVGYLNRPEENAESYRNGWFFTGDVGRMDEQGIMFLMDRKKDMIVSGGENIYTSEVEAALYQHPDIQECAVIGVPDQRFGETLFAVIVPSAGKTLTQPDIIKHCRNRIGGFKIPRQMDFVKEMPKSAMGKILKNELRLMYGSKEK